MVYLRADKEMCVECGKCEETLPTFQSVYKGYLPISLRTYEGNPLAQASVKLLIEQCPVKGISLS